MILYEGKGFGRVVRILSVDRGPIWLAGQPSRPSHFLIRQVGEDGSVVAVYARRQSRVKFYLASGSYNSSASGCFYPCQWAVRLRAPTNYDTQAGTL